MQSSAGGQKLSVLPLKLSAPLERVPQANNRRGAFVGETK